MMQDAYTLEGVQGLILPSPICLNRQNFPIKLAFNKTLKIMETLKDLRLMTQEVNPHKFTVIIYKTDIVAMSSN
jgi:hypothetical protein